MKKKEIEKVDPAIVKDQELTKLAPLYTELIERAERVEINTGETFQSAVDTIREIISIKGRYEKLRKHLYKPIKDHIKVVEGEIKVFETGCEKAEREIRIQMADYESELQKKREEEERILRKKQQDEYDKQIKKSDKKGEVPPPPPEPVKVEAPKTEGISYRDEADFEIVDPKQIPYELQGSVLMIPDEKIIRKLVKAGITNIPGVKVFMKKVPVIREEKIENL